MTRHRSTNYRSVGLPLEISTNYEGNAYVYLLASRVDPNLCKIGKGNPILRCEYWNNISPHGGILKNNLSVFAAYSFDSDSKAYKCESQAQAIYNFVNLNPNVLGGEQEFFALPPNQAKATLDILYNFFYIQKQQSLSKNKDIYLADQRAAKAIADAELIKFSAQKILKDALNLVESAEINNSKFEPPIQNIIKKINSHDVFNEKLSLERSRWIDEGRTAKEWREKFVNDPLRIEALNKEFDELIKLRKLDQVKECF
jgi:hypothetical protein